MIWVLISLYVACVPLAAFIFCSAWRFKHDVGVGDLVFFTILSSAGPISLVAALIVFASEYPYGNKKKVLWKKKCK